jgi:hypothetical protein
MIKVKAVLLIIISILIIPSCKQDNTPEPSTLTGATGLQIPDNYVSANFDSNVVIEKSILNQMKNLNTYMKKGVVVTNTLSLDSLNWYFASAGTPTLKSVTANYYQYKIEGSNGYFATMASSSGNTWNYATAPNATGGVIHNRLVDKYGVETLEVIDKGFYASVLYNRIAELLLLELNDSIIDKMVAIYGATPAFPNTNNAASTPTPDAYIANYTARRDKNDGNGLYTRIKKSFLKLQAAVKGGAQYNTEKDQAIADLKFNIEKALMATAANYCHGATTKLTATTQDSTTIAAALHDIGEAIGFIHGFKAVYPSNRKITDAEVDQLLNYLNFPPDGTPSPYLFVQQGATQLPKIVDALALIQSIYGFSATEMEEFKQNWITVQGR